LEVDVFGPASLLAKEKDGLETRGDWEDGEEGWKKEAQRIETLLELTEGGEMAGRVEVCHTDTARST
jgi:hypothetical protein